jgi:hypothetical protein
MVISPVAISGERGFGPFLFIVTISRAFSFHVAAEAKLKSCCRDEAGRTRGAIRLPQKRYLALAGYREMLYAGVVSASIDWNAGQRGGDIIEIGTTSMMTVPELAADALEEFLGSYMRRRFGSSQSNLVEIVPAAARIALECIGNSDALYHNIEHTLLVTLAGHDILRGRALHKHMTADDYAHVIIACLFHDIGYVRGLLADDHADGFVIDATGHKITLPRGSSDAALMPYHVDRSKRYVLERIEAIAILDERRIAQAIEGTRFPPVDPVEGGEHGEEASIVRAADLIGQLGDPNYIRKANALYHEFEEVGINRQLGYASPADIVDRYPQFYWKSVSPHIQTAIGYLNMTSSGRQWIANLYGNVFRAEREIPLSGPQA